MRIRAAAVLSTLALSLSTLFATAPAQAAGEDCVVTLPSRVYITSPYRLVTVKYSGICTVEGAYATWKMYSSTGYEGSLTYNSASSGMDDLVQYEGIYDYEPLGTWQVIPNYANGTGGNYATKYTQNSTSTSVRLGSRLALSSSRSGSYVTLNAKATRYNPSTDIYRNWGGTTVRFYYKASDGSWKWARTVTADAYGRASAKISSSSTRTWKAVTASTSNTWGRTSASTTR